MSRPDGVRGAYRPLTPPLPSIRIVSLHNECMEKVNNDTNNSVLVLFNHDTTEGFMVFYMSMCVF